MFEQLFGSKTRVKLIKLFLDNPEKSFYVRELTRVTDSLINSVRRELDNLVNLKLVIIETSPSNREDDDNEASININAKKFYKLNKKNVLHQDLARLFSKAKIMVEDKLVEKILRLGEISYISLGGYFVEDEKAKSDILVVGEVDPDKFNSLLSAFEKEVNQELNYTLMNEAEYNLRKDIADNFLESIINNENNIVFLNKLKNK